MAILCDMHSLMPVGFLMFLSMNDFLPGCLFCCCCNLMFHDWSECVMSVLAPQNIPRAISVLTLGSKVILCYCDIDVLASYPLCFGRLC